MVTDKFNLESYKNGGTGKPAVRRAFLKKCHFCGL